MSMFQKRVVLLTLLATRRTRGGLRPVDRAGKPTVGGEDLASDVRMTGSAWRPRWSARACTVEARHEEGTARRVSGGM
jgi:hypothetical protein